VTWSEKMWGRAAASASSRDVPGLGALLGGRERRPHIRADLAGAPLPAQAPPPQLGEQVLELLGRENVDQNRASFCGGVSLQH